MKSLTAFLLLFTSPFFCLAEATATTPQPVDVTEIAAEKTTVRLLTIGNSFSRNATRFLGDLVKAGRHQLEHTSIVVGGASLELHASMVRRYEANAQDPKGLYKNKMSLKRHLKAKPWDVVTIQQASIKSHNLETYEPFAKELYDYIKTYAPEAKVMLHETWAYRVDDPRFSPKNIKSGEPLTQQQMYEGLREAYTGMAKKLNVGIIPTGDAFYLADTDPEWQYKVDPQGFNPNAATPPQLPDQKHSLHVGWQWKKNPKGKTVLSMDGHHANVAGEYLGACVFYETLYQDDVRRLKFAPEGLEPEYAAFLRETAHQAVTLTKGP